jgi:NADPH:quinone reductase-like Zn-dependent oxidoreductase
MWVQNCQTVAAYFKKLKTTSMKASIFKQYGSPDVLHLEEVPKPVPKKGEILVRIKATAVNSGDIKLRKADPFAVRFFFGLFKPKREILGSVFSGVIENIGEEVKDFQIGDLVFGHTDMRFGAYAEYLCVPEKGSIALKPVQLTHEQAAVIPFGGVTAMHFLRKAKLAPGQKILIIGASGAVGTAAVQLSKSMGAMVTGVCSTSNIDLVRSLGADQVIDYTREDITRQKEQYDLIFDTVNAVRISAAVQLLSDKGQLIASAAGLLEMLQGGWFSLISGKKVITGVTGHSAADIRFLKDQVESGKFKPVIDRIFHLHQLDKAHAYVEGGHKKGNVAVEVSA